MRIIGSVALTIATSLLLSGCVIVWGG